MFDNVGERFADRGFEISDLSAVQPTAGKRRNRLACPSGLLRRAFEGFGISRLLDHGIGDFPTSRMTTHI